MSNTTKPPVVISFFTDTSSVNEDTGSITVFCSKTGDTNNTISIDYITTSDSALPSINYVATSGSLVWSGPDTSSKNFKVPIINTHSTGSKKLFVSLINPSNCILGSPSVQTINIFGSEKANQNPSTSSFIYISVSGSTYPLMEMSKSGNFLYVSTGSGDINVNIIENSFTMSLPTITSGSPYNEEIMIQISKGNDKNAIVTSHEQNNVIFIVT